MKVCMALGLLFLTSISYALDIRCTLSNLLDDQVFEESLSFEEYPDLRITAKDDKIIIRAGSQYFTSDKDFDVKQLNASSGYTFLIQSLSSEINSYVVAGNENKAIFMVIDENGKRPFAEFKCSPSL